MPNVVVCGSATASVQPDLAVVSLGLSYVAAEPASALDEIGVRSQRLEAALAALGLDRRAWVTDGVSVAEEWQHDQQSRLVGFRASSGVTATVRDLGRVSTVIKDAVGVGATIRGIEWRVDEANPARTELLAAAARDARHRAQTYVTALDLLLGPVELISEQPIAMQPAPYGDVVSMARSAKFADSSEMALGEGQVHLHASIHVRFGVLPS